MGACHRCFGGLVSDVFEYAFEEKIMQDVFYQYSGGRCRNREVNRAPQGQYIELESPPFGRVIPGRGETIEEALIKVGMQSIHVERNL